MVFHIHTTPDRTCSQKASPKVVSGLPQGEVFYVQPGRDD